MVNMSLASGAMHKIAAISNLVEKEQQVCRAGDHNKKPCPSTPSPPGPDGFLTSVLDPRTGKCLSWPTDPKVYAERHTRIFTGLAPAGKSKGLPARAYTPTDPVMLHNGICAGCRQKLNREYADPDTRGRALLRWALAVHTARAEAVARYASLEPDHPLLPGDEFSKDLAASMRQTARQHIKGAANILPDVARLWASSRKPEAVIIRTVTVESPLRIAAHCAVMHPDRLVVAMAVLPDPDGAGTQPWRHRIYIGAAPTAEHSAAAVNSIVSDLVANAVEAMAKPIGEWLPRYGASWEYLYLHPDDYGNKRILPGKARLKLEAACGKRLLI